MNAQFLLQFLCFYDPNTKKGGQQSGEQVPFRILSEILGIIIIMKGKIHQVPLQFE